jgi:hypothetical protein
MIPLALALLASSGVVAPAPAIEPVEMVQAPGACHARVSWMRVLTTQYGERRLGMWVFRDVTIELYANDESRSWTMLRVTPDGVACLWAEGNTWMGTDLPRGAPH